MVGSIPLINKEAEKRADQYPKNWLIQSRLCGDLVCFLMKQAKVKNKKDHDDQSEYTKKNGLPVIIVSEKGE